MLAVERVESQDRRIHALAALGLAGWLLYTRVFWTLRALHATIPPCPILLVTGHPCPLCGGTRSFASMWQGRVGNALHYYPLGPLLFFGTFLALGYTAWVVAAGRRLRLARRWRHRMLGIGLGALAVSWTLKLFWLGN